MKSVILVLFATLIVLLLSERQAETQTFKIATTAPEGTMWMQTMREAAAEIKERTQGRVRFKFYPGGVMGSDRIVLRKMRIGQLHGGAVPSGALAQVYPDSQLYGLPLLFRSYEEVDYVRVRMDPFLISSLEERGFVTFAIAESGFAYLLSNQPIRRNKDLKGKKAWVFEGDIISQTFFETIGVSPVPLPVSDVLTGLQTGLLETVGSPPIVAVALQWHTKVKYLTDTPLLYTYGTLIIDRRAFRRLRPEDQATVRDVMARTATQLNQRTRLGNRHAKRALQNQGITLITLTPEELVSLREFAAEARQRLGKQGLYTPAVMETLQRHLDNFRNKHAVGSTTQAIQ